MSDNGTTTIWGLEPVRLHDAYWQEHGVCVVRRGESVRDDRNARWYLLVGQTDLVLADLAGPVRPLHHGGKVTALRLTAGDAPTFAERVEFGRSNRLHAITRQYDTQARRAHPVFLTRDRAIAQRWCEAPTVGAAARSVRLAAGPHGLHTHIGEGRVYDAAAPAQRDACLRIMMTMHPDLPHRFDDTVKLAPGIWRHASAHVDRRAAIHGPAWIGAHATVDHRGALAGPCLVPDTQRVHPPIRPRRHVPVRGLPQIPVRRAPAPATMRRCVNAALAGLGLVATLPLYPLIMLAIWLEDGRPFFFCHTRQSRDGRYFVCHKFRTMHRDAESRRAALADANVCDGPQFHIENDPRLLRIGRLLRRFHLDELPQFYDVLTGRMDLIGPRPSPDGENRYCPAWRDARLSVNPGITGLWQVRRTRAPQTDFQEWIRYDLEYIDRRSWRLDLEIILRTIGAMASGFLRRRRRPAQPAAAPAIEPVVEPVVEPLPTPSDPAPVLRYVDDVPFDAERAMTASDDEHARAA